MHEFWRSFCSRPLGDPQSRWPVSGSTPRVRCPERQTGLWLLCLGWCLWWGCATTVHADNAAPGARLELVGTHADAVELVLETPAPTVERTGTGSLAADRLTVPGYAVTGDMGLPPVPYRACLLAAPRGARLELTVRPGEYTEIEDVTLAPVDGEDAAAVWDTDEYLPRRLAETRPAGVLRGVPAHALCLYPVRYNSVQHKLRVFHTLHVRVQFTGERRHVARPGAAVVPELHSAFLNAGQAVAWSAPAPVSKPAADNWYDRSQSWLKLHVDRDGMFRIDAAWLSRYMDPQTIDPRTFRLFQGGEEQPLLVHGQSDGFLDPADWLLFVGRYRRGEHDFESRYGMRNTYWLTWGGAAGLRYEELPAAPVHGFPERSDFWSTTHVEIDQVYDALIHAPDVERDHWFWRQIDGRSPTKPGSGVFPGLARDPVVDEEYAARVRVALYGGTPAAHHTVAKLSTGPVIADSIWGGGQAGQTGVILENEVPAAALTDSINRVVVQVYADQEKYDLVYMNWFEIDYRRRFQARNGYLAFTVPGPGRHRITVSGLRHRSVELVDPARGVRLTGVRVDSGANGVRVTFEDEPAADAHYVLADSGGFRKPCGEPDALSAWRQPGNGAEYVVIANPSLIAMGQRLAAHRRRRGLSTAVVSAGDIYDEFSYGLTTADAISDFIRYAYAEWAQPPAYVVLLGGDTYDYRNILGQGVPAYVPTRYYQSEGRGCAPSDFLFSLVDGDDLLPDLSVGRLPASNEREAETMVNKVIAYDGEPAAGDWRGRVLYLAGYHSDGDFSKPSDSLAARYTEPYGLQSVKIYNAEEDMLPNERAREFLNELERGALLLNFNGHGSSGNMWHFFSLQLPEWDYMSQVSNGPRLPFWIALSCLNGMFVNPAAQSMAEAMTAAESGGAIAYVAATAKSRPSHNNLLSELMYAQMFGENRLQFGPVLDRAKAQMLAARPSYTGSALTMQLFGDPAQELDLPAHPDYQASGLTVSPDQVCRHSVVQVEASVRNLARQTPDSLQVLILERGPASAAPGTLLARSVPGFAGTRQLAVQWATGQRRGAHELELQVDARAQVQEEDERNNRLTRPVEILEPLLPDLVAPSRGAVIGSAPPELVAAVPGRGGPYQCDFAVSLSPTFAPDSSFTLDAVPAVNGVCAKAAELLDPDASLFYRPVFWKARVNTPKGRGPWSPVWTFRVDPEESGTTWSQRGPQWYASLTDSLALVNGRITLSVAPRPLRPGAATREDSLMVSRLNGAGVVCTDGRYLYAKRWYYDDSTIYPGTDFFARIGTGFGGTTAGGFYGTLADSTTGGVAATYHGDGYIYSESGRAFELERLNPETGVLDTVQVPSGLLEMRTGQVRDGHSLITSDGRLVYNVAASSDRGMHREWSVRVFDPAAGWRLVREFASPPTENGFTYEFTDGILADGHRLYFIEWRRTGDPKPRRIRAVNAMDGGFLDEWVSDQDVTGIISGQYDWTNNKVWLGDLWGGAIYRYSGVKHVDSASVTSPTVGPAAAWDSVRTTILAGEGAELALQILVQEESGWSPVPGLGRTDASGGMDLSGLDAARYPRIRLRTWLGGNTGTDHLFGWEAVYQPRPSLRLEGATGRLHAGQLQVSVVVRNLSAFSVTDAELVLERSDGHGPVTRMGVAELAPGEMREMRLDSVAVPPEDVRLYARIRSSESDADQADDRSEVLLLFQDRAPITVHTWPDSVTLHNGDVVPTDQGLLVSAKGVEGGTLRLSLDGVDTPPDSVLNPYPDTRSSVLLSTGLAPGAHELDVRLLLDGEQVGQRVVKFRVSDGLALANTLPYPNPAHNGASFTYVLSAPAEVQVELFTLSGRLIRRLGPERQEPGFRRLSWDGRDASGDLLANGTYLFRVSARNGTQRAARQGPIVVLR